MTKDKALCIEPKYKKRKVTPTREGEGLNIYHFALWRTGFSVSFLFS